MISFDPKMPKVRLLRSSFLRCSGHNCALEQGEDGFPPQKRARVRSRFSTVLLKQRKGLLSIQPYPAS